METKSTILSEEQVNEIVTGEEATTEEVVLPSEEKAIELPEKYAGKSAEEVYRLMKKEEEYFASKKGEENGSEESTEETSEGTDGEGESEETPTTMSAEELKDFTQRVIDNGGEFTEDMYKELEAKGISKDMADTHKAGLEAQATKEISETFESAGTTQAEFQEAAATLRDVWSEDRIVEFNTAMNKAYESGDKTTQKILIQSAMEAAKTNAPKETKTYHSNNSPEVKRVEGYATKSDYIADVNNTRYRKDPSYRALVEKKFLATNRTSW